MVSYKLEGMTCDHCKITVEKIFTENGKHAVADRASESVSVEGILTTKEWETLRNQLGEEGYTLGNRK